MSWPVRIATLSKGVGPLRPGESALLLETDDLLLLEDGTVLLLEI